MTLKIRRLPVVSAGWMWCVSAQGSPVRGARLTACWSCYSLQQLVPLDTAGHNEIIKGLLKGLEMTQKLGVEVDSMLEITMALIELIARIINLLEELYNNKN